MALNWKDMSLSNKIIRVFAIALSLAAAVFAIVQITGAWDKAINVCCPLLGIEMLCQTYLQWNVNRKIAYINLASGIFVVVCSVIVFFID